jgi:hypothetical protein
MSMTSGTFAFMVLAAAAAAVTLAPAARADDAACIAASEQSIPLRQQGKLHEALKVLAVCADAACPGEVKAECAKRIETIKGTMPTLILGAKDGLGNDLTAVTVIVDGAPLPGALDGQALALDPGEHTFRFELAGQPPVEKKIVLRQGEKERRESVVLGPPGGLVKPPPAAPSFWTPRRTLAVVSAGLGVVGIGIGAAFGAFALSSQSREKSDCSGSSTASCPSYPQGLSDYNIAQKDATGATVGLVLGGALAATGVVLWFTAPRQGRPPASVQGLRVAPLVIGTGRGITLGVDL